MRVFNFKLGKVRKRKIISQCLRRIIFYYPWPYKKMSSLVLETWWKQGLQIVTELGDQLNSSNEMNQVVVIPEHLRERAWWKTKSGGLTCACDWWVRRVYNLQVTLSLSFWVLLLFYIHILYLSSFSQWF